MQIHFTRSSKKKTCESLVFPYNANPYETSCCLVLFFAKFILPNNLALNLFTQKHNPSYSECGKSYNPRCLQLLPRLGVDKLSRSQPDLSRAGARRANAMSGSATSPRPKTNGREDLDPAQHDIWPPAEMVEILIQENSALKLELETCYQKVAKSQKVSDKHLISTKPSLNLTLSETRE